MAVIDRVEAAQPSEGAASAAAKAWQRALEMTAPIGRDPALILPLVIDAVAERFGSSPALLSETETLSYRDLAALSKRYAGWALNHGVGKGDVVALMMPNCPQYLAIWLGIVRVGGVVALVNTNLVGAALRHSFETVSPKHIIVGRALLDAIAVIRPDLAQDARIWAHGGGGHGFPRIESALAEPSERDDAAYSPPALDDRALYIYTSGTTGLPKAAEVSHCRLMQWSHWFAGMMERGPSDRMYNCLPMYHSIGGVVAIGAPLVAGGSVVIRERFSASRFWDDVAERDCTLFQYIGELCRYLVNSAAASARDGASAAAGLRQRAARRCLGGDSSAASHIPRILEFYAATEGNFSLYNCEGKPGAIGRIPPFLAHRFPVALIKFDVDDRRSRCAVPTGFAFAARRTNPARRSARSPTGAGRFEGYTDAEARRRKMLRNVFAEGDAWFRTGDLMRRDRAGYFYFVDRVGDTFRWKGENVSTGEVEEVIAACPWRHRGRGLRRRCPRRRGPRRHGGDRSGRRVRSRACCAGTRRAPAGLRAAGVPAPARWDRATGTFKPQKQALAAQGYDPAATGDALYFDDRVARHLSCGLTRRCYRRVQAGEMRL